MKTVQLFFLFTCLTGSLWCQEANLDFFMVNGVDNSPALKENANLEDIADLQEKLIIARNNAVQVSASSEALFAPFFNSNGSAIDVTTTPSTNAIGYDVGITNGGLYSAQVNITRNLFNRAIVDNLLFQNKLQKNSLGITSQQIAQNLTKNINDAYIMAYQLQLQERFTQNLVKDLENRLKVLEFLVKKGITLESDYLLLQQEKASRTLELQQISNSYQVALNQLFSLTGMKATDSLQLTEPDLKKRPTPEKYLFERRFSNDSLLVLADQKVFENQYKPQVQAYGNTGLNAVELKNMEQRFGLSAGLRLTIPIYDGNQRRTYAQQNKMRTENLQFYRKNTAIQMENDLDAVEQQMNILDDNLQVLRAQIEKQENILEIYKGKLVQGQVSIIDYLNVVQNYRLYNYTLMQTQTNRWLLLSQYNFLNW